MGKTLSVLVTAGGTIEEIDTVRGIANFATGQLGCLIADAFSGAGARVTYLCGEKAARPAVAEKILTIRDTASLISALETLLGETAFDCVIHSMAVSDFAPAGAVSLDKLSQAVSGALAGRDISPEAVAQALREAVLSRPDEKKISSKSAELVLFLKQTPKAIGRIKALAPGALLVGFKLLSGVTEAELLAAGQKLMEENHCDFVLLNDLRDITPDGHKAILLGRGGIAGRADTKPEIAQMIAAQIIKQKAEEMA